MSKSIEIIFVLVFSVSFVSAVLSCQRYKDLAASSQAELERAEQQLEAAKTNTKTTAIAAEIDAKATEHISHEHKKFTEKATEIRMDCASIDAELDDRLRQLAIDAYRAATVCGEAEH